MPSLFILVGIPGSGKSTWAETYLANPDTAIPNTVIHSSDAIREELSGDAADQSRNKDVFEVFHRRIGWSLASGWNVVADSTALDKSARRSLRDLAAVTDEVHLIYFSNNDQAIERNRWRTRVVPDDVMTRMQDKYESFVFALQRESILYNTVTEIRSFR